MGDLSQNFSKHEFACQCGCGYGMNDGDVDAALVMLLERIRARVGGVVRLNSGCRCEKHNLAVGGATHSTHKLGQAADIRVEGGWHRRRVLDAAILEGAEGVGVAKTFIHVDTHPGSQNVARPSAWSY